MKKIVLILLTALAMINCSKDNDPIIIYTVTFDTDGGIPAPSTQKIEEGSIVSVPSTNPTKVGYVFVFWHLSGATTAYNFQTPVNRDITLYAKWQEEAQAEYWQVAWNLNGGAWSSEDNHATQVLKGGTLAEPITPIKAESSFDGWYKEAELTNKVSFPYDVSGIMADFMLYAKWKTEEEPGNNGMAMIASGEYCYFSLKSDGSLYALGRNDYGQFGTNNKTDLENLTQVATGISALHAGVGTTFIVKADGSLLGTGLNDRGQLGIGNTNDYSSFTTIPVSNVKTIAASLSHSLLLKNDGSLLASGLNYSGQLGTGDETNKTTFTATNLTSDVISVSAGAGHSLALKKDGTVWGAGDGSNWTLSEVATNAENPSFVQIFSGAKAIATGVVHSLILASDGTVYASGINKEGQLGIGSAMLAQSFTQVIDETGASLSDITHIAAGHCHSLALKSDGTLWAAGLNDYGQLGTGDENNRNKFIKIATGVKTMSAGEFHTAILKDDGTIITYGQVNPWSVLKGSGTIIVKVQDPHYYQYIRSFWLEDRNEKRLLNVNENITNADSGYEISLKPGTYNLGFLTSNSSNWHYFNDCTVADNETVTILYEKPSISASYRWTVTRSK